MLCTIQGELHNTVSIPQATLAWTQDASAKLRLTKSKPVSAKEEPGSQKVNSEDELVTDRCYAVSKFTHRIGLRPS